MMGTPMAVDPQLQDRLNGPIQSGSVALLYAAVEAETHHDRPGVNAETKRWISRELRKRYASEPAHLPGVAAEMAGTDSVTLRSVATIVLREFWETDRDTVFDLAMTLANDEHWEVREWAASLWARYLDDDFERAYPVVLDLSHHDEVNIRRAMVLAAMGAASKDKPERAGPLLELLELHLPDRAAYIKKNLGPFAIGAGLLRAYPEQTLDAVEAWATREDEMTRWNVAMVAAAAEAAKHHDRLLPLLNELAGDERRSVRMAVRSGLRTLCRRVPDACQPVLEQLSADPSTSDIVDHVQRRAG